MAIKEQVQVLLNTKMDRQEFIKHVAIGLVAVTGASTALRAVLPKQRASSHGYGMMAYGGKPETHKTS